MQPKIEHQVNEAKRLLSEGQLDRAYAHMSLAIKKRDRIIAAKMAVNAARDARRAV